MTLQLDIKENIIALIKQKDSNKTSGTLSYTNDDNIIGLDEIILNKNHYFQYIPNKNLERNVLFVAGESGSGKSYFIREYSKEYNKMYKNNPIYLISYLMYDETLEKYDKIERINVFDDKEKKFLNDCLDMDLKEFENSFIIFDDIDSITNKKEKEIIYNFLYKLLRIGRHFNISVAYLGHELYNNLGKILNESHCITFFPQFLNYKKMKYLLESHFGLSNNQIDKIKKINSRSITYIKGCKKVILTDSKAFIL